MKMLTDATWTKLNDGSWGVRINLPLWVKPQEVRVGTLVLVTKRDGTKKGVRVGKQLNTFHQGVCTTLVCALAPKADETSHKCRPCCNGASKEAHKCRHGGCEACNEGEFYVS